MVNHCLLFVATWLAFSCGQQKGGHVSNNDTIASIHLSETVINQFPYRKHILKNSFGDSAVYTFLYHHNADRYMLMRKELRGFITDTFSGKVNTERGYLSDPDATLYILNYDLPEDRHRYIVRFTADTAWQYLGNTKQ